MVDLPNAVDTPRDVRSMLDGIIALFGPDSPFVAQVAQLARQSGSLDELEAALVGLYRLGLEHDHPYLPDLADELLRWVERRRAQRGG